MSTWEKDDLWTAACPCGVGSVAYVWYSPENGYSKAHADVRVDCDACRDAYSFGFNFRGRDGDTIRATPAAGGVSIVIRKPTGA